MQIGAAGYSVSTSVSICPRVKSLTDADDTQRRRRGDRVSTYATAWGHSRRFVMSVQSPVIGQFRTYRSSVDGCAPPVIQGSKLEPGRSCCSCPEQCPPQAKV